MYTFVLSTGLWMTVVWGSCRKRRRTGDGGTRNKREKGKKGGERARDRNWKACDIKVDRDGQSVKNRQRGKKEWYECWMKRKCLLRLTKERRKTPPKWSEWVDELETRVLTVLFRAHRLARMHADTVSTLRKGTALAYTRNCNIFLTLTYPGFCWTWVLVISALPCWICVILNCTSMPYMMQTHTESRKSYITVERKSARSYTCTMKCALT